MSLYQLLWFCAWSIYEAGSPQKNVKCQLLTNENVLFWTAQGKSLNQYKRDLDTNTSELQKLLFYIKILASVMRRELAYNLITEVIKQIMGSSHKQVRKARIN